MQVTITEEHRMKGYEESFRRFRFTGLSEEMYLKARARIIANEDAFMAEHYENMRYSAEDILDENGILKTRMNGFYAIVVANSIGSPVQNVIEIHVPAEDEDFSDKETF